jgi:hypothetical protein
MDLQNLVLDIEQRIEVKAPLARVFEGLVGHLTERNVMMPLRLERTVGGRWFRDLGDGAGHLWGFVQVWKPPTLIEIQGPLFMSYPVSGHLQLRLTETAGITTVTLRHRAFGLLEENHRQTVQPGWQKILAALQRDFA